VYKTKDFISYEQVPGLLHKVANTGMWECVDFFAVAASSSSANRAIDTTVLAAMGNSQDDIRHVLKASMDDDRRDYYAIGRYIL
jgi:Glycosyl hydrolases family 32 N-terminal domain